MMAREETVEVALMAMARVFVLPVIVPFVKIALLTDGVGIEMVER